MKCSKKDCEVIARFLAKAAAKRKSDPRMRVVGFPALFHLASSGERVLLKKFLKLRPRAYGFKGECYGITAPPKDLVMIQRERIPNTTRLRLTSEGQEKYFFAGTHFLPRRVFDAYEKLNRAMLRDIGCRVFVLSGYRSPAYQLVVFLETLKERKFNLKNTIKRVALPGYSRKK